MQKEDFTEGMNLLAQPALPLVSMVQFFYVTGEFATVSEVVDELPEPIETGYAVYEHPRALLRSHLGTLAALERIKGGHPPGKKVVDASGREVDPLTACSALVAQQVMERELEAINSALCGPCGCTLCCTGPDDSMTQEFFEIPLQDREAELFGLQRFDSDASRRSTSMDEPHLEVDGAPFYRVEQPTLFHWRSGWSMILPRNSSCPALLADGRCREYARRPGVCRRPQIFSYVVEPGDRADVLRLRSSLLAVIDCPYVQVLREEIAAYAAACELEFVLRGNKQ